MGHKSRQLPYVAFHTLTLLELKHRTMLAITHLPLLFIKIISIISLEERVDSYPEEALK